MKKQLIRFLIVGGFSTIVNYLIFYILYKYIGINYMISSSIGYFSGVLFGYFFNKNWTFSSESKSKLEVLKYYLIYTISFIVGIGALKILVEFLLIDAKIANVVVICITTILNFIGTKFFVFIQKEMEN